MGFALSNPKTDTKLRLTAAATSAGITVNRKPSNYTVFTRIAIGSAIEPLKIEPARQAAWASEMVLKLASLFEA
jgi:hypothetical protein